MQSVWNKPKIFQPLFFQQIDPTFSIQIAHTFESGPWFKIMDAVSPANKKNPIDIAGRHEKACWAIQMSFSYNVDKINKKVPFPITKTCHI